MGQCFPCATPCLEGRLLPRHRCQGNGRHGAVTEDAHLSVEDAVQEFEQEVDAMVSPPFNKAMIRIIKAFVLGPGMQHDNLRAHASISESTGPGGAKALSLVVDFGPAPLTADIATRSRLPFQVRFCRDVRFTVTESLLSKEPMELMVKGLAFTPLPDVLRLRDMLTAELGVKYSKDSALAWWLQHKDQEFPLSKSKLHRNYESIAGTRAFKMVPTRLEEEKAMIWGYIGASTMEVEAFDFWPDAELGTRMTLRKRLSPEEVELSQQARDTMQSVLGRSRVVGEKIAASAVNFGAMVHSSRELGQAGANVEVIAKLFSAARWWGPALTGWQRWDETWLCTDKTGLSGRVIAEQGRLIWHVSAEVPTSAKTAPSKTAPDASAPVSSVSSRELLFFFLFCLMAFQLFLSLVRS